MTGLDHDVGHQLLPIGPITKTLAWVVCMHVHANANTCMHVHANANTCHGLLDAIKTTETCTTVTNATIVVAGRS
jgi:hypothetical protein